MDIFAFRDVIKLMLLIKSRTFTFFHTCVARVQHRQICRLCLLARKHNAQNQKQTHHHTSSVIAHLKFAKYFYIKLVCAEARAPHIVQNEWHLPPVSATHKMTTSPHHHRHRHHQVHRSTFNANRLNLYVLGC